MLVDTPLIDADGQAARIRQLAREHPLKFVIIMADGAHDRVAAPVWRGSGALRPAQQAVIPTCYVPAEVIPQFGGETLIASDSPYADLDGDGAVDLALGRIPADNGPELAAYLRRVMAYENAPDHSVRRRSLHFVAGLGGFGPIADTVIQQVATKFIDDGVPGAYDVTLTHASPSSRYFPGAEAFHDVALRRLSGGGLAWIYMGHGHPTQLDSISTPHGPRPIATAQDAAVLACPAESAPLGVFLACYAGAFDQPDDCLAERFVLAPGGPIAAVAATRVAMPYGIAAFGDGLLKEMFNRQPETLGEMTWRARRRLMSDDPQTVAGRRTLDALAGMLSPSKKTLAEERAEHAALFQLFGDPLIRLPRPPSVGLRTAESVRAGASLAVRVTSPIAGDAIVELALPRTLAAMQPPIKDAPPGRRYAAANEIAVARQFAKVAVGDTLVRLPAPKDASGEMIVRAFIQGPNGHALGSTRVTVKESAKAR